MLMEQRPPPPQQQQQQQQQQQRHNLKLTLVVILGMFALGLGTIVLTFQMMVFNLKRLQLQQQRQENDNVNAIPATQQTTTAQTALSSSGAIPNVGDFGDDDDDESVSLLLSATEKRLRHRQMQQDNKDNKDGGGGGTTGAKAGAASTAAAATTAAAGGGGTTAGTTTTTATTTKVISAATAHENIVGTRTTHPSHTKLWTGARSASMWNFPGVVSGLALWEQVVANDLQQWDAPTLILQDYQDWMSGNAILPPASSSSSSIPSFAADDASSLSDNSNNKNSNNHSMLDMVWTLQEAARMGNADAQHLVAIALASGMWPLLEQVERDDDDTVVVPNLHMMRDMLNAAADEEIIHHHHHHEEEEEQQQQIAEKRQRRRQEKHDQFAKSWLLWHMAAMDGNVEAAMALGYRMLHMETPTNQEQKQKRRDNKQDDLHEEEQEDVVVLPTSCERALPYFEAAANGIMDELEAWPHSRGKVLPAQDLHLLPEIHMHGGTSSQLSPDSKPHESPEAIQYLELRAASASSVAASSAAAASDDDSSASAAVSEANTAAHQLAQYYHYGLKGVVQNMTMALGYYELAAEFHNWEAAGQAGKFYVWSLGLTQPEERKLLKALRYFRMGTPGGLEACTRRYREALKARIKTNSDKVSISVGQVPCDHPSVNGMGLLTLLGIPMVLPRDVDAAEAWFTLGRDMGNMDAAYNLAMLRLGWKTHWKSIKHGGGSTTTDIHTNHNHHPSADDLLVTTTDDLVPEFMMLSLDDDDETDDVAMNKNKKRRKPTTTDDNHKKGKNKFANMNHQTMPSAETYRLAIQDLTSAATKGHIQAHHRLGMMYSQGVVPPHVAAASAATSSSSGKEEDGRLDRFSSSSKGAKPKMSPPSSSSQAYYVKKDCAKALHHYQWMIKEASLSRSRRTTRAYNQYMAGQVKEAFLNYWLAAETGHAISQVNAAFLLEQYPSTICQGMLNLPVYYSSSSSTKKKKKNAEEDQQEDPCKVAALRLYRAAATQGHELAALKVGDYYYYQSPITQRQQQWYKWIVFPEQVDWVGVFHEFKTWIVDWLKSAQKTFNDPAHSLWKVIFIDSSSSSSSVVDDIPDGDETDCNPDTSETCSLQEKPSALVAASTTLPEGDLDLARAAEYYRLASQQHKSARAHFNLGFLHEWGWGLKQDFPLAKRHYDLAKSQQGGGAADMAVSLALWSMKVHEWVVKAGVTYQEWKENRNNDGDDDSSITADDDNDNRDGDSDETEEQPRDDEADDTEWDEDEPLPSEFDIILKHLLSWESFFVLVLTYVLIKVLKYRDERQRGRM